MMAKMLSLKIGPPSEDDPYWLVTELDRRVLAYGEGATLVAALRSFLDDVEGRSDTGERLEAALCELDEVD